MYPIKLISITALFAAATSAIPSVPPSGSPEKDHAYTATAAPEPDLRFVNHTLAHPNAEIHVSDPKEKRGSAVYGYYECSGALFSGTCHWTQITPGQSICHNRLYGPLGSMGPDKGVTCSVYSVKDCKETGDWKAGFKYPGSGDCVNDKWLNQGSLISCPVSYRCTVTG